MTTPYNTGRIKIGSKLPPPIRSNGAETMSLDAIRLQRALLHKEPSSLHKAAETVGRFVVAFCTAVVIFQIATI